MVLASLGIFVGSLSYLGWGLPAEPHFVDESAYIAQSFYGDLYVAGRWNHPAWLDYAGYDLPPLPKYIICAGLWLENYRRPSLSDAHAWYANTSRQFVTLPALVAARRPSVLLGAVGCVAIFWIGTLALNPQVGGLAAFLLAVNPLYHLHARRAMSDVPAECFTLLALAVGLVVWKSASAKRLTAGGWGLAGLAGALVGLATLAKLNGVLSGLVLASWVCLGSISPTISTRSKRDLALAAVAAAAIAFGTFVVLNPFLLAQPPQPVAREVAATARLTFMKRVKAVYDHRATVSLLAMKSFPNDALPTLPSKIAVVAVQGFGRFGLLGPHGRSDSTRRFDWAQDSNAVIWGPLVLIAWVGLIVQGVRRYRSEPPDRAWLLVAYFTVVLVVVTGFIPLAWDRYMISIQPPAALVGATVWDALARWSGTARSTS